jgi:hypothetical protein
MPEIKSVIITVRRPLRDGDFGECAEALYEFDEEKRVVTLVDDGGKPLPRGMTRNVRGKKEEAPRWSARVLDGQDPRTVAGRLLHQKVAGEKSGSDFWRPLPPGWGAPA